jgi:O-acetylhomoserine/O-acetylserine sulfhydrylase-like pyridoxal-dependent enzyme
MMIASKPLVVPAKTTHNNLDSDERKAVGTKRKYHEMAVTIPQQQQEKNNNELSNNSSVEISKQR